MINNFKVDKKGVRKLLRSEQMKIGLASIADDKMRDYGAKGYETSTYTGKNRVNVSIGTATREAAQDNMDNNTLLKMVQS